MTTDNHLYALAQDDGRRLWSYTAITQNAGLLGGSPAVAGIVVVAAFSSGELYGLSVDSGRTMWRDTLAGHFAAARSPRWRISAACRSSTATR